MVLSSVRILSVISDAKQNRVVLTQVIDTSRVGLVDQVRVKAGNRWNTQVG